MDTRASILEFLSSAPAEEVTNYQRAIVEFRRIPDLIPIGAYLAAMEIVADDRVGTACTDCVRKIIYSPTYFNSLTVDQCISALLHENLHKFLNFFPRFERWAARQDTKWSRGELLRIFNIGQDYFINWMIKNQWNLPLGDGWLYDDKYTPSQYTTEMIADELLEKKDKAGPKGGSQPAPPKQPPAPEGDDEGDDAGSDEDKSGGEGATDDESDDESDGDDATGGNDGDTGDEGDEDSDEQGKGGGKSDSDDDSDEQGEGGSGDELDENDPTDSDDSELGDGDDIMLPEEYDDDIDNVLDENQLRSMETNNRQDMSDALRATKGQGKGYKGDPFTAAAQDAAYKTGFNFRSELMRHANKAMKGGKYTWSRPNRRMKTAAGLPMPARRGKQIGTVIHIIDSSGSTDGPMVRYFLEEVTEAMRSLDYEKTVVIWCSEYVAKVVEFTKKEVDSGKAMFNGIIYRKGYGTNFPPAFEYIAEHYRDARVVTYLTDGGVGEYDVRESKEIMVKAGLGNVPLMWLLADDFDYEYVKRFIDYTKKYRFGRCTKLPMEEINR